MQVDAFGWVRAVQAVWYISAVLLSSLRLVRASLSLCSLLRMHGANASTLNATAPACLPITAPDGTASRSRGILEPLLVPVEQGDPVSRTAQRSPYTPPHSVPMRAQRFPALWNARRHTCRLNGPVPRVSFAGPRAEASVATGAAPPWATQTPSFELLPGRPLSHAYSTLPLPLPHSSSMHALYPSATTEQLGQSHWSPVLASRLQPPSSCLLPAAHSTRHMAEAQECNDGEATAVHVFASGQPSMPNRRARWYRGWSCVCSRFRGGDARDPASRLELACLAVYCLVACAYVCALNREVVWNQV